MQLSHHPKHHLLINGIHIFTPFISLFRFRCCLFALSPTSTMNNVPFPHTHIHTHTQHSVDTFESHEGVLYCRQHFKSLFSPKAVEDSEPGNFSPLFALSTRNFTHKCDTNLWTSIAIHIYCFRWWFLLMLCPCPFIHPKRI